MFANGSLLMATDWLFLSVIICFFAWVAGRRLAALLLPLCAVLAAVALWIPTGTPRLTAIPSGKYAVLGAKIVVDQAIYVLLDGGNGEPIYYRLPYTASEANELQGAQDAGQGQPGSVKLEVGQDGGTKYDGPPPVSGEAPKPPEQPAISIP